MRTVPSSSSVAGTSLCGRSMVPVAVQAPVPGSYTSAPNDSGRLDTTSTVPSDKSVGERYRASSLT